MSFFPLMKYKSTIYIINFVFIPSGTMYVPCKHLELEGGKWEAVGGDEATWNIGKSWSYLFITYIYPT